MPVDKYFDRNRDGKLGTFETIFRDAHIYEMKIKQDRANRNKKP